jgi:glycerol-3-phosphate acyltransferase PlsY
MNMSILVLGALAGYLIGSISFARVITRLVRPEVDLNEARALRSESGEKVTLSGIGAYSTSIALGGRSGVLVGLFDILKAVIPVLVLRIVYPEQPYALISSIFVVLGHNYPVYHGFNGGRGLSPMLGSLFVLEPIGMFVAMFAGMLIGILIKQPATGMIFWLPMLTLWSLFVRNDVPVAIYSVLLLVLFLSSSYPEIKLGLQLRREGRQEEYDNIIQDSAPMMRMMNRLSRRIRFWEAE